MQNRRIHVVLGYKSEQTNIISQSFRERLDWMAQNFKHGDCCIISGGITGANTLSEAAIGFQYMEKHYPGLLNSFNTILEQESQTSAENFMFTYYLALLGRGETYIIYTGEAHRQKARLLAKALWPGIEVNVIGCPDSVGRIGHWLQLFIGVPFAWLDPRERWIARLLRVV